MNLESPNISYLIISSEKLDDIISILYAKEYDMIDMKEFHNGIYVGSILAYGPSNDELRNDFIFLLNNFNIKTSIIKYTKDEIPKIINKDGSEKPIKICNYEGNIEKPCFLYKALSFSFNEVKRYWVPRGKDDIKIGMMLEYFNNNKWNEKLVENPIEEWDNLYKLLLKYNKVRIVSSN